MKRSLAIGGAMLALAAFASAADAAIINTTSMSRIDVRVPMISNLGAVRVTGLEMHSSGPHFKKPIDSDNGGPDDPPIKTPKGSTGGSTGGTTVGSGDRSNGGPTGGYYGGNHGPWQPDPPLACRGRPGGC